MTVTRAPSAVSTLTSLALSSGTLSPAFDSGTTSYTASVTNTTASVTPTVTDSTATVKVNGVTVASGAASASLPLVDGSNTLTTVVTAEDGSTTSTYTVTVTYTPPSYPLFTAAETALPLANAGLVTLSPLAQFSVVTDAASHGGVNALKFTTVDSGTTYAERTVVGPSLVSFWWRVSSEQDYDTFSYKVDNVLQQTLSGETGWFNRAFSLGAGTHKIRWIYSKDESDANNDDAGYLDDVVIVDAYNNLAVTLSDAPLTGASTLPFGTVRQDGVEVTKTLTLKNTGTINLTVTATLPASSGFFFSSGLLTYTQNFTPGQEVSMSLKMQTTVPGVKSALLQMTAVGSRTAPPALTLSGYIDPRVPIITCASSAGAITSGQAAILDMGITPAEITLTLGNVGDAELQIGMVSVSPTADFQVVTQPAATIGVNGTTTFTVRALDADRGAHLGTVTIASSDLVTPLFSFPVSSRSYLAVAGTGYVAGTFLNNGTLAAWDTASQSLPSGGTGLVLRTGNTPNSGETIVGATFDGPGILSWNWKVSAQKNFDWLLCEVNGLEVAGISTKTAAWQSQVVQIPAGSQVRWIYRKDAANTSGTDSGHLTGIRFDKFTAPQTAFNAWSVAYGTSLFPDTPVAALGGIQAMFAWLGGVDPVAGPAPGEYQPTTSGDFYQYRYRISKSASGRVQPQVSTDLISWNSRTVSQKILSEDAAAAVVELSVPRASRVFSRLSTDTSWYDMVKVKGGTLPSSSGLSGQSVSTFYIAKTETTWGQWQSVRTYAAANGYDIGNSGTGNGDAYPVTNVTWYQAAKSCNARSEMEGLTPAYQVNGSVYKTGDIAPTVDATANGYRLPTEAQWEFAARGGVSTQNYEYSGSNDIYAVAWWYYNAYNSPRPVATKLANELGVSDMSGSVWEWCESWYPGSEGSYRVYRGGSWSNYYADNCRVAYRNYGGPSGSNGSIGFRVARPVTPPALTGFAYVEAGTMPNSSEFSGQSVSSYYIAKTETTWGQWQSVRTYAAANGYDIGNSGAGNGDDYPVTNVSWHEVMKWCNARSEMEGLIPVYKVGSEVYRTNNTDPWVDETANGYRLPLEREWEFAARGGVSTQNYEYSGSNDINAVAWYNGNSGNATHAVGTKQANELGVSDMSGNVSEWCENWYPGYEGTYRVYRGGGWIGDAYYCRVAYRTYNFPSVSLNGLGFRVVRRSVQ